MKKLIIPFVMLFAVVTVSASMAQSKSAERKKARIERQAEYAEKLAQAVKDGQFTFTAQTFQANIGNPINIAYPNNFFSLYGNALDVRLPYYTFSAVNMSPDMIDFIDAPVSYTVKYDGNYFYVTIDVSTPANAGNIYITQMGQYEFHLTISAKTGYTVLTVTPQLGTSATYTGVLQMN